MKKEFYLKVLCSLISGFVSLPLVQAVDPALLPEAAMDPSPKTLDVYTNPLQWDGYNFESESKNFRNCLSDMQPNPEMQQPASCNPPPAELGPVMTHLWPAGYSLTTNVRDWIQPPLDTATPWYTFHGFDAFQGLDSLQGFEEPTFDEMLFDPAML